MSNRVTLKDIANYVGVSKSLISLYLNEHPLSKNIADSTKKSIDDAVKKFNYRPSATAKALRNGKSKAIGLVVGNISWTYNGFYAEKLFEALSKVGYQLLISVTLFNKQLEEESLVDLLNRQTDGIFYALEITEDNHKILNLVQGYPILMVEHLNPKLNTLVIDVTKATCLALQSCIKNGCKKVFFHERPNLPMNLPKNISSQIEIVNDYNSARDYPLLSKKIYDSKADAFIAFSTVTVENFIIEWETNYPTKPIPKIIYSYTLPINYLEHPAIIGTIINPFEERLNQQVKLMIEIVEKPQKELVQKTIPAIFKDIEETKKYFIEQCNSSYFKNLIIERRDIAQKYNQINEEISKATFHKKN